MKTSVETALVIIGGIIGLIGMAWIAIQVQLNQGAEIRIKWKKIKKEKTKV